LKDYRGRSFEDKVFSFQNLKDYIGRKFLTWILN
jgi:hypothetical protein